MTERRPHAAPRRRDARLALTLGIGVTLAAALATWFDADGARSPFDAQAIAERALQASFRAGSDAPDVLAAVTELRRAILERPLDSRTRVVYASLLLGLSTSVEQTRAAAFHARRAAALSPVTLPVVRSAAIVLAHAGDIEGCLTLVRDMFGYDAPRAARLLASVELVVPPEEIPRGVPETPEAQTAWAVTLRLHGRREIADEWLARTIERWPEYMPALDHVVSDAARRRDWARVAELLPTSRELPRTAEAARLFLYRAQFEAENGRGNEAHADVEDGLRLRPRSVGLRILAGDVHLSLSEFARARDQWNRALHHVKGQPSTSRSSILTRLARLEDRTGQSGAALRLWRLVLDAQPEHAEARRRVDELTGGRR